MISLTQCMATAGLAPNEAILGVGHCPRHRSLLASYLLHLDRGPGAVRKMIVADLRSFLDLGALRRAADLLVVLRLFLSEQPEAMDGPRLKLINGSGRERQSIRKDVRRNAFKSLFAMPLRI